MAEGKENHKALKGGDLWEFLWRGKRGGREKKKARSSSNHRGRVLDIIGSIEQGGGGGVSIAVPTCSEAAELSRKEDLIYDLLIFRLVQRLESGFVLE